MTHGHGTGVMLSTSCLPTRNKRNLPTLELDRRVSLHTLTTCTDDGEKKLAHNFGLIGQTKVLGAWLRHGVASRT